MEQATNQIAGAQTEICNFATIPSFAQNIQREHDQSSSQTLFASHST